MKLNEIQLKFGAVLWALRLRPASADAAADASGLRGLGIHTHTPSVGLDENGSDVERLLSNRIYGRRVQRRCVLF